MDLDITGRPQTRIGPLDQLLHGADRRADIGNPKCDHYLRSNGRHHVTQTYHGHRTHTVSTRRERTHSRELVRGQRPDKHGMWPHLGRDPGVTTKGPHPK